MRRLILALALTAAVAAAVCAAVYTSVMKEIRDDADRTFRQAFDVDLLSFARVFSDAQVSLRSAADALSILPTRPSHADLRRVGAHVA